MLEFTQKVSSTYLKTFFTNFEEVYGYHQGVKIVMKSLTVPTIDISGDKTTIKAEVLLRFLNPHNNEIEAIKMHANLTAIARFELMENFKLSGEI